MASAMVSAKQDGIDSVSLDLTELKTKKTWSEKFFPTGFKEEVKALAFLSWPMILTYECSILLPTISVIICGQLGTDELGAVSLSNSVINITCLSVGMGLATACDTLFSQSFGSGNDRQVGVYVQKAIIILFLACFPCWAIHLNTETLLRLIGQDPIVSLLAGRYLVWYLPAVLFNFMFQVLSKWLQAQNIVIPCVVIGIIANAVNIGLHFLLVFYMDLQYPTDGSAMAQVVANFCLFLFTLLYIVIFKKYKTSWSGWSWECFRDWSLFVNLALPGMLMLCLEWWSFEIGTLMSGTLSTVDLGAQSVIFYIETITVTFGFGLGVAASIRVGQALGAGKEDAAKTASRVAIVCCTALAIVVAILYVSLRYYLPRLFSQDIAVINKAAEIFPILAGFYIFDCIAVTGGGVLRGCGRQTVGAIIAFVGYYVIALPIGLPLMMLTDLTVKGLWIGYMIGLFVEAICFSTLILTTNWKLETEQAQIRAGLKEDPLLKKGDVNNPPVIEEEPESEPEELPTEKTSLLKRQKSEVSDKSRTTRLPQTRGLRRSYSSSQLITTLHGRRFSKPSQDVRKYSVPTKERRFSSQYTPQIQEDVIAQLENRVRYPVGKLIFVRLLAVLGCVGILVIGIVISVTISIPFPEGFFNGTSNGTTPMTTTFIYETTRLS